MTNAPRVTKANGHIVQADWNQTDPLKMDYIHNKPEIFDGDYHSLKNKPELFDGDYNNLTNKPERFVVNKAGGEYTKKIKFSDLDFQFTNTELYDPDDPASWWGVAFAEIPGLPSDETIEYSIKLVNGPGTVTFQENTHVWGGVAVLKDETAFEDQVRAHEVIAWIGDYTGYTETVEYNTTTHQGSWEVCIGEASGGASLADIEDLKTIFSTADLEYSYSYYEGEDEAKGPVHSIDLHSDREIHYEYPVTELTITDLHKCFGDNIVQEWVVSFIAGDIDPVVVVPENLNNKPVVWINGKPQFRSKKKYMLIFKEVFNTIYIETKLLSEDKVCDQWILSSLDQKTEPATYGDITLPNVELWAIVQGLRENELFEIIGGKTTLVATQYAHPDYEAAQGQITIPNAPDFYIQNCINLKIWKIRASNSLTDLEVHILGTFVPSSGDSLPGTTATTDSTFYIVLSEYLAGCITGGGVAGHSLIKYSNIL